MKIWALSDLHLEVKNFDEPLAIPDADVCVLAGDLCRGPADGVRWLAEHVAHAMPTVYIAGNHEFYGTAVAEGLQEGRAAAAEVPGVHFLENEAVWLGGVRILGCTLWTDYRVMGNAPFAMMHARDRMNDYRRISLVKKPWMRFTPQAAAYMHSESKAFLWAAFTALPDEPTVVISHHLPHPGSVPPRFEGDMLNAAYASDLGELIEEAKPLLWVHGHTHDSCDYRVGSTRIVCNPRGYDRENAAFDRGLVVEVGP